MRSHTTRLIEKRVAAAIEAAADSLASGEAKSYESYKELCGFIRGLREAMAICDDIEKELDA